MKDVRGDVLDHHTALEVQPWHKNQHRLLRMLLDVCHYKYRTLST